MKTLLAFVLCSLANHLGVMFADGFTGSEVSLVTTPSTLGKVDRLQGVIVKNVEHSGSGDSAAVGWVFEIGAKPPILLQSDLHGELAAKTACLAALCYERAQHHASSPKKSSDESAKEGGISPVHAFWIAFVAAFVTAGAPSLIFLFGGPLADKLLDLFCN